jgi:hypothetical protein
MPARNHAFELAPPTLEAGEELRALAASMLSPADDLPLPGPDAGEAADDADAAVWLPGGDDRAVTLTLAEVVGDGNNEVVFANEAGLRGLVLEADESVVERGIADSHVTMQGEDVSGLAYVTFASGVTFYFPPELDLATTPLG